MREENYLYFSNAGGSDTDKDMAMFPASTFRGAVSMSIQLLNSSLLHKMEQEQQLTVYL